MKNKQRLYIDVSRLVLADMGSGIPRVARALLSKLLYMHTSEYEIYPVYAKSDQIGYGKLTASCEKDLVYRVCQKKIHLFLIHIAIFFWGV